MLSDILLKFFLLIPFFSLVTFASTPSSEFILASGSSFKVQVAKDDLLAGVPFESNLELAAGDFFKLTDGLGSKTNSSCRTFARDGVEDWVITFSNLKTVEIKEIRVFSWNGDYRAQQDFDLAYSTDRGKTFAHLAKQGLDIGLREVKTVFGAHAATGLIDVAGAALEPVAEGDIGFGLDRTGGGDQDDNQCESRRAPHGNAIRAGLVGGGEQLCAVGDNAQHRQGIKVV